MFITIMNGAFLNYMNTKQLKRGWSFFWIGHCFLCLSGVGVGGVKSIMDHCTKRYGSSGYLQVASSKKNGKKWSRQLEVKQEANFILK